MTEAVQEVPSITNSSQSSFSNSETLEAPIKSVNNVLSDQPPPESSNTTGPNAKLGSRLHDLLGTQSCTSGEENKYRSPSTVATGLMGIFRRLLGCNFPENPVDEKSEMVVHAYSAGDISYTSTADYEAQRQIDRMTSWNTLGTIGTLGTAVSGTSLVENDGLPRYDDDGNQIPTSHYKAIKKNRDSKPKRKRVVRFDYPHISSLRECPRHDPANIGELFFTEEELDQYEHDRVSTHIADDVEVVAVSSSLSNSDSKECDVGRDSPVQDRKFSSYLSTPARNNIAVKKTKLDAENKITDKEASKTSRLPITVPGKHRQTQKEGEQHGTRSVSTPAPKKERLIKSVQIYLRERSTGRK